MGCPMPCSRHIYAKPQDRWLTMTEAGKVAWVPKDQVQGNSDVWSITANEQTFTLKDSRFGKFFSA